MFLYIHLVQIVSENQDCPRDWIARIACFLVPPPAPTLVHGLPLVALPPPLKSDPRTCPVIGTPLLFKIMSPVNISILTDSLTCHSKHHGCNLRLVIWKCALLLVGCVVEQKEEK